MNSDGLNEKKESINNFINKFDIRICIMSETHTAGKEKPHLNNQMTNFFNNRGTKRNKAIAVENSIAFSPPLLIIATYGCQSSFKVNDVRKKGLKLETKIIKDDEGRNKWCEMTHQVAEKIIDQLNEGKDGAKIVKFTEHKAFKQIKQNAIKRMRKSDNEIFYKLTKELETMEEDVAQLKETNKISKARKDKIVAERGEELFAMFDREGKMVENKEEILKALSDYNKNLLNRREHDENWEEIFKIKQDLMETLKETQVKEYKTLSHEEFLKANENDDKNPNESSD